jgi:excisionase family DNA binding protein
MLMTPAELAAELRTSERTIARMVADGCPSLLIGSRRRFERADVLRWTREQAACRPDKTKKGGGTPTPAISGAAFTAACRRVQLRVMPSGLPQS